MHTNTIPVFVPDHFVPTIKMVVPVPSLSAACKWKRKINRPYIAMFLITFLSFLFYWTWPVPMDHSKEEDKDLAQNNIAFVMELKDPNDSEAIRFVFRLKQCLASICQHSSINLTIHIFANSLGRDESLKVLEEIADYCTNDKYMKVKFYDVMKATKFILPSVELIKVSLDVIKQIVFIYT